MITVAFLAGWLGVVSPAPSPMLTPVLDGGYPARTEHRLRRSAVALQAVRPLPGGRAEVHDCSGVLIAPDVILTAGHCIESASGPHHIHAARLAPGGGVAEALSISAVALHPDYVRGWWREAGTPESRQREIRADLALLRIRGRAGGDAIPAPLAQDAMTESRGPSYIIGAGLGPSSTSLELRIAPVGNVTHLTRGAAIALGSPQGARACRGDSGGPVAALVDSDIRVWGIASAVLRAQGGCSGRVAITFVDPAAIEAMRAALGH